jgi:filamentous hemagglutinin family protein
VLRAGSATIELSNAQRAVVQQSSQKAVIDWRRFNVAKDISIQFVQPNASAIALNRVTGAQSSRIDGSILANGQVWLLNPNGVLIGKSGRINTHGFLASTLGLSTDNFMQGNYTFQTDPAGFGSVVNEGEIISAQAGYAVLAGRPSALEVRVDAGALLDASALGNGNGGTVVAWSDVGNRACKTYALGSFKARGGSQGGDGGRIETSGYWLGVDSIQVDAGASKGKAGLWLLDPPDIYISDQANSVLPTYGVVANPGVISTALMTSNVTLRASGVLYEPATPLLTGILAFSEAPPGNFSPYTGASAPVFFSPGGVGSGSIFVNAPIDSGSSSRLTLHAEGVRASGSFTAMAGVIAVSQPISLAGDLILLAGEPAYELTAAVPGQINLVAQIGLGGKLTLFADKVFSSTAGSIKSSGLFVEISENSTLDGKISGTGGVTLKGTSTTSLVLANVANDFTGSLVLLGAQSISDNRTIPGSTGPRLN